MMCTISLTITFFKIRFMSIFFIFVMGFSQGYYVLFQVASSILLSIGFKNVLYLYFQSYDEDAEDAEDHPMPNPV